MLSSSSSRIRFRAGMSGLRWTVSFFCPSLSLVCRAETMIGAGCLLANESISCVCTLHALRSIDDTSFGIGSPASFVTHGQYISGIRVPLQLHKRCQLIVTFIPIYILFFIFPHTEQVPQSTIITAGSTTSTRTSLCSEAAKTFGS